MALEITSDNFKEVILPSKQPALMDFWAEWCGPCRMIGPVIEELAQEYKGQAIIGKVNIDHQVALATLFNVTSIPTLILVKNGREVAREVGAVPKSKLMELLDEHISTEL